MHSGFGRFLQIIFVFILPYLFFKLRDFSTILTIKFTGIFCEIDGEYVLTFNHKVPINLIGMIFHQKNTYEIDSEKRFTV